MTLYDVLFFGCMAVVVAGVLAVGAYCISVLVDEERAADRAAERARSEWDPSYRQMADEFRTDLAPLPGRNRPAR